MVTKYKGWILGNYHWSPTLQCPPAKKEEEMVLCCPSGEYGYIGSGTVDSIYRPKFRNGYVGTVYVLQSDKKIVYGRYRKRYIRHPYSSEEYHKAMIRYRNHEIKSRPNGHGRRCHLSPRTLYDKHDGVAFCRYRYPWYRYGRIEKPWTESMEKLWRGPTIF